MADSLWVLDDSQSEQGEAVKVLALHLARPPLTESELTWKRGAHGPLVCMYRMLAQRRQAAGWPLQPQLGMRSHLSQSWAS